VLDLEVVTLDALLRDEKIDERGSTCSNA